MFFKKLQILTISTLLATTGLIAGSNDKNNLDFAKDIVALNLDNPTPSENRSSAKLTDEVMKFSSALDNLNLSKADKEKILQAVEFAAKSHHNQFRQNASQDPYLTHPIDVALVLINEGGVKDPIVIEAAILHDCLKANPEAKQALKTTFGDAVASIVEELSFSPKLPLMEKKRLELDKAPKLSKNAKLVKLSDRIVNLKEIKESLPSNWNKDKLQSYLLLSDALFKGLKGTNSNLEKVYQKLLDEEYQSTK